MQTHGRLRLLSGLLAVALLAACAGGGGGSLVPGGETARSTTFISHALPGDTPSPTPSPSPTPGLLGGVFGLLGGVLSLVLTPACTGLLHCNAIQNKSVNANANPHPSSVAGFTPSQLWAAYELSAPPANAAANGPTIAIVDAFDDPTAEADLAVYRAYFNLPPCTTANGCFNKVNGALEHANYPKPDTGWSMEISLDLAMASAACPTCKITLVEAASDNLGVLAQAVDAIAATKPAAISNSYGVPEAADAVALDSHYDHPGIAITASIGDQNGVEFPASSSHVIAVGGTTLHPSRNARGWAETALSKSGIGCSSYVSRPGWQNSACGSRGVADVSFVADPTTGLAVYDTQSGGWIVLGGTSAGAPFIAGLAAQGGKTATAAGASSIYANAAHLNPIGNVPAGDTTLGSPKGLAAF